MSLVRLLIKINVVVLLLARLNLQVAYSKPTSGDAISSFDEPQPVSPATNFEPAQSTTGQLQNDPIRAIHYHFDQEMDPFLKLHKFNETPPDKSSTNGNNVTCNDGSPAGYYKRLNNHSKTWIIYLQGGGYCGSEETCQLRWRRSAHLMSSNFWPKSMSVEGILSSEAKDNPYLWNANHIYVPYCSSDSWTGLQEASTDQSSFAFMGSKIIEKVLDSLFDDLPRDSGLFEARFILLAGDSAGATGVILNLDKVNRFVQQRFAAVRSNCSTDNQQLCEQKQVPIIRGLADSGWFLDNEPYDIYQQLQSQSSAAPDTTSQLSDTSPESVDCDKQRCSPLQSIKQAMLHWNGQVPVACANRQASEPWRCYFAYRAYPTLRTPLFVVQWLYDEAQLMVDNIIRPGTISQWNYVNKLVSEMRASLENVTALFAPSCFSHSLIIKQSWNQININGFKLPHILNSWEEETLANQPSYSTLLKDQVQEQQHNTTSAPHTQHVSSINQVATINREQLYDRLIANQRQQQHQQQQLEAANQHQHNQLEMRSAIPRPYSTGASSGNGHTRSRSRKKKRNNSQNHQNINSNRIASNANRLSRSTVVDETTIVLNNNVPDALLISSNRQQETGTEKFRLIDTCGWPQCNRDCPNLDLDFGLRPILSY